MRAEVVLIQASGSCSVRTANQILFVFKMPPGDDLNVGDQIEIDEPALDRDMRMRNLTRGTDFVVRVPPNDAHDLRLPAGHGTTRIPSIARLLGS